jgi:hypothetical protein
MWLDRSHRTCTSCMEQHTYLKVAKRGPVVVREYSTHSIVAVWTSGSHRVGLALRYCIVDFTAITWPSTGEAGRQTRHCRRRRYRDALAATARRGASGKEGTFQWTDGYGACLAEVGSSGFQSTEALFTGNCTRYLPTVGALARHVSGTVQPPVAAPSPEHQRIPLWAGVTTVRYRLHVPE